MINRARPDKLFIVDLENVTLVDPEGNKVPLTPDELVDLMEVMEEELVGTWEERWGDKFCQPTLHTKPYTPPPKDVDCLVVYVDPNYHKPFCISDRDGETDTFCFDSPAAAAAMIVHWMLREEETPLDKPTN